MLPYCRPLFDEIVVHLSSSIGTWYFQRHVIEGLFFAAEDHETCGLLEPHGAGVAAPRTGALTNLGAATDRLRAALRKPASSLIRSAQRWYAEAVVEPDPVKRFLWCLLGLEQLTHELARRHYLRVMSTFSEAGGCAGEAELERAITAVERGDGPGTLHLKFAIMALGLFPSDVDPDVRLFADLTRARDDLAHGRLWDPARVPTVEALTLLNKYLSAALATQWEAD